MNQHGPQPIVSAAEAQRVIAQIGQMMDSLIATVEEETAHVRAGRLTDASQLETAKAELARNYAAESARLKISRPFVNQTLPGALAALRGKHETFQALLKINMTVLATAHAVSEGIIRGVSGELARKQAPSTYGARGTANDPGPRASQPLAVSRSI